MILRRKGRQRQQQVEEIQARAMDLARQSFLEFARGFINRAAENAGIPGYTHCTVRASDGATLMHFDTGWTLVITTEYPDARPE